MNDSRPSADRREAKLYWDELLRSSCDPAAMVEGVRDSQTDRGLMFGDRPFCSVARPRFVTSAEMELEHRAVTALASAVGKVRDAVLESDELRARHLERFDEWAGGILSLEPRFHEAWSILRFDSFLTQAGLRFVEVNGDIPMGSVCNDGLVSIFRKLGVFQRFEERYDVRPNLVQPGMIQTFLHAWHSWGGAGVPRMCVLAFPGGMQDLFAELNVRDLENLGFEVAAAHPDDLEFDGRRLRAHGRVVDLVYRIMHLYDCQARVDEIAPLLQALRQEAVCMVNPFRSALVSHKCLFALLTDDSYDFGFSGNERAAIRAHVPWGRVLRDGRSTDSEGRSIDLVEHVLANKDELVVKPAHEAGGAGVHLGWTCSDAEWAAAVAAALSEDNVVQQRIEETREEYPRLEDGFPLESFYEDTDPFSFPAGHSSVINRVSSAEITNVAQGGSFVPTFVIDAR